MSPERFQTPKQNPAQSMEREIKKRALPTREEVFETLKLRTHNNSLNSVLLDMHRSEMMSYIDYNLTLAAGEKPENSAPHWSDPRLSYHYRIVRERVSGMPEKLSKGYKKNLRRKKAEQRRASK